MVTTVSCHLFFQTAITAACKKRKRAISVEGLNEESLNIQASAPLGEDDG